MASVWCAAGIDLALRDRWVGTAVVFYATPPSLLGFLAALLAGVGKWRRQHRLAVYLTALLGLGLLVQWWIQNFQGSRTNEVPTNSIRVLFWNVGRGQFASWEQIAKRLERFDADVIALAEATDELVQTGDFWRNRLPEFQPLPLDGGLLVLAKGKIRRHGAAMLAGAGRFRRVSVEVHDASFDLILADIISSPLRSREPPLRKLFEVMSAQRERPTIVVGDFNTPPNSLWLDAWRSDWVHAWMVVGEGYQATWPHPLPVLTLDQIWGNRGIQFHRCACGWSSCSDHRPVWVEMTVVNQRGHN